MAKKKKSIRTLKYKTINKTGEAPIAGTTGHQKDTIFVKQVTDTTFTPIVTDMNGKALELEKSQSGASTFREILEEGNYIPGVISFLPENNDSKDTSNTGNPAGALGIDATTYTYHFGKFNPSSTAYYGVQMGYNALANNTGQSNTAVGAFAMENNVTGEYNTAYGYFAGNKLTAGTRNTFIGVNAGKNLPLGNALTLIGSNTGGENLKSEKIELSDIVNISPIYETYLTGKDKWVNKTIFGFNASDNTLMSSATVYIGASCGESGPTKAVGSICIGTSPMSNMIYRNYNNIFIGNMLYTNRRVQVHNSVLIGNHFQPHNHDNILAIHNSKTERVVPTNALIYGEFDQKKLKINGALSLNLTNAPAVNNTFTKVAVANDNGDLTFLTLGQLKALLESVTPEPLNV